MTHWRRAGRGCAFEVKILLSLGTRGPSAAFWIPWQHVAYNAHWRAQLDACWSVWGARTMSAESSAEEGDDGMESGRGRARSVRA